jgi:hypothetical protein
MPPAGSEVADERQRNGRNKLLPPFGTPRPAY